MRAGGSAWRTSKRLRAKLGLDRPVHIQYGDWLWDMLRGRPGGVTVVPDPGD